MIEIRKLSEDLIPSFQTENSGKDFVGVFENGKVIEYASYTLCDEYLIIYELSYFTKNYSLADALIKTLIFYADLGKARYIILTSENEWIASAFGFEKKDDKYILDIYKQNTACSKCGGKEENNG